MKKRKPYLRKKANMSLWARIMAADVRPKSILEYIKKNWTQLMINNFHRSIKK